MAAGLGFKTFNTGDVLTAADVNGYLMQGVLVFADATARDAAITSPQEGQFAYTKDNNSLWYYTGSAWAASGATGDIEGVTAGVGISGGGTSGTVTITNDMATTITAAGDIVVGTGSGTYDNLPIGTTGQVLTADTTVSPYKVKWAAASSGAMTLISRQTFSNVVSISFANVFTTTYENYLIYFTNVSAVTTTDNFQLQLETSGGAQATNYYGSSIRFAYNSTTLTHEQTSAATAFNIYEDTTGTGGQMHITGTGSGASGRLCWTGSVTDTGSGEGAWFYGFRESTTTYTGITFKSGSTNITGTIAIYGLAKA